MEQLYINGEKGEPKLCEYCLQKETTKHMLYDCKRIQSLWKHVSEILKINITWKNIVCGFISADISDYIKCLNHIISVIVYAIYKENSFCKYECYKSKNIICEI